MGAKTIKDIARNCDELMIYHFDKARSTGDLKWLGIGYTGREEVRLPDNVDEVFGGIMNEYCELTGDNKSLQYYELTVFLGKLILDYEICKALIMCLISNSTEQSKEEVIEELKHRKITFNGDIKDAERQLRSKQNKIAIKQKEKEEFEDVNGEALSLERQKIHLMRVTELGNIDLKSTSVKEWVEIGNVAKEIITERKKWQNK